MSVTYKEKNLILFATSFLLFASSLWAEERICFGQVPQDNGNELQAIITISESNAYSKCSRFYQYYKKHVDFPQSECEVNKEQMTQNVGYAPLPVFFRGWESTPKADIAEYAWTIKGPIIANRNPPVVAKYQSFNAAFVFETPGEYEVELTVTSKSGQTSTDVEYVTVWERDGLTYFVDSIAGDDRYDGLSEFSDITCNPEKSQIGSCPGPWKTATRAFGELSPYRITSYPNGKYTANAICKNQRTENIIRYKQGNFKTFRSSAFIASEAKKDKNGNYLPAVPTKVCYATASKKETALRPGDRVLFKRGQNFELETAVNVLTSYQAKNSDGIVYQYERLDFAPIVNLPHWTKAIGVHFGAYGSGDKPLIENVGATSSAAIALQGVGMMGLSMSDLEFDLSSDIENSFNNNRAILLLAPGNPVNLTFTGIDVKEMEQGIIANSTNGQGLFIFNSTFFDSNVTQLFTQTSYQDVAIVNNKYDYSANHLIYSSISSGLIINNELTKPAFGRTALRIYGGNFDKPNRFIWIADNTITGWVDPRDNKKYGRAFADGHRYNYLLVHLGPNTPYSDLATHDLVFTGNKVSNAETLIGIGALENAKFYGNTFTSEDYSFSPRVILNQNVSRRPLKNIHFTSNKFIELSPNAPTSLVSSVFYLNNYFQVECADQVNNQNLDISGNDFYLMTPYRRIFDFGALKQSSGFSGKTPSDLSLDQGQKLLADILSFKENSVYTKDSKNTLFKIGGDFRAVDPKNPSSIDWTHGYDDVSSTGGDYRLFNQDSDFYNAFGHNIWHSTSSASADDVIGKSNENRTIKTPPPAPTPQKKNSGGFLSRLLGFRR